jgi:hypothetical protein
MEAQMLKKILVGALVGTFMATSSMAMTESEPVSDGGITPYIIDGANPGGNRTCEEVGTAFFGDSDYYEFSSDKVDYNGGFDGDFPAGITVDTDGTYVSWSSTFGIGAVIVKGSDDANIYVYDPQWKSDSGLASPLNPSGNPAGLSNLTFCWNPEDDDPCYDYMYETAWSAGTRYVTRGDWATYTEIPEVGEKSVILYAGQHTPAGVVTFFANADGSVDITIDLDEGWVFKSHDDDEDAELVKIQGYETKPPATNPSPGQFEHKFTMEDDELSESFFEVKGLDFGQFYGFYGVHAEVAKRVEVECEDEIEE